MLTAGGRVKILDFGLARYVSETAPLLPPFDPAAGAGQPGPAAAPDGETGEMNPDYWTGLGTPDFLAPEEAEDAARADTRADVYSLGCTLYRWLAGQVPFPGGGMAEKVVAHRTGEPTSLEALRSDVPPAVADAVRRMMAKQPEDRYQTPAEAAAALAPFAHAAPRRVLVVDDSRANRDALADLLSADGFVVSTAADGSEALDRLRSEPAPDLILLDLMMPVMDGWAFLQEHRRDQALAHIPVVVVSALDRVRARAAALGAADFLTKPVEPDQLATKLHQLAMPA
jgi:CheY-like chemotaxis protein